MPITSTLISSSHTGSALDEDEAWSKAWDAVLSDIFAQINDVLSKDFKRVKSNNVSVSMGSGIRYFRESYALGELNNKYLVVQLGVPLTESAGTTTIVTQFILSSQIIETSDYPASGLKSVSTQATLQKVYDDVRNDDGSYTYNRIITLSFYEIKLQNDYITLHRPNNNSTVTTMCTDGGIGKVIINDIEHWSALFDSSGNLCVYDDSDTQYWLAKKMFERYAGSVNADGYIPTVSAYFANSSEHEANASNIIICSNMPLKDALITDGSKTPYGAIYKVGGVDYFALWSKILIKL